MTWTDGSTYSGDFLDGKADGFGVKNYADGSIYEGEWKQDMRHTVNQEAQYYNGKLTRNSLNFWKNDKEIIEGAPQESPWGNMRKVVRLSQGVQGVKKRKQAPSAKLKIFGDAFRLVPEDGLTDP